MNFIIKKYINNDMDRWDEFVLKESMNGTFLQTRHFINYHEKGKFEDHSLIVAKGNTYVAVILGCVVEEDNKKIFFSHKGTSFGGIVVNKKYYSVTHMNQIFDLFENYLQEHGFNGCVMKETPDIFSKEPTQLTDYFYYYKGYQQYDELNFYLDLAHYRVDILNGFTSGKRRDCRYSLNNNLMFRELLSDDDINDFHRVLLLNLNKLGVNCVHTANELIDLKNRFNQSILFFGVYLEEKLIAGSMIFIFDNGVYHTQYLASDEEYLKYFPMEFLIYNLVNLALTNNSRLLTFGICTEDKGRYLNFGLSRFKEGFGAQYTINRMYQKLFD